MWLVVAAMVLGSVGTGWAETPVERSVETRFQIDLQVPQAALQAFLPTGWSSNVAPQGPAKDCNLRLIFTDQIAIHGAADGKPVGQGWNRTAELIAPVKDPSGAAVQMVIGGISADPTQVPGAYGNYLAAATSEMHRVVTSQGAEAGMESQDWVFAAKSGEHLEMHIEFVKGMGNRSNVADVKYYSAKDPAVFQISHQEQVLEILRNATTHPTDRVKTFRIKASGGAFAKLFDGTEKVLSWDNILWLSRSVSTP